MNTDQALSQAIQVAEQQQISRQSTPAIIRSIDLAIKELEELAGRLGIARRAQEIFGAAKLPAPVRRDVRRLENILSAINDLQVIRGSLSITGSYALPIDQDEWKTEENESCS